MSAVKCVLASLLGAICSLGASAAELHQRHSFLGVREVPSDADEALGRSIRVAEGFSQTSDQSPPHYDLLLIDALVIAILAAPFVYYSYQQYEADEEHFMLHRKEYERIRIVLEEMKSATNSRSLQVDLTYLKSDDFTKKVSTQWKTFQEGVRRQTGAYQEKVSWRWMDIILQDLTPEQLHNVKQHRLWSLAFDESHRIGEKAALVDKSDLEEVMRWVYAHSRTATAEPATPASDAVNNDADGDIQIFIKTPSGKVITLDVEANSTVGNMKSLIKNKEAIPRNQQCLSFAEQTLEDACTLQECNIAGGSTITCTSVS
jgi:hypothetical protein